MPMPPTFQRTLSRTVDDYLPVAEAVEGFCAEHGLSQAVSFKVRLIVEELVLNLIDHAVGSVTNRVNVRIDLAPGRVIVVLEDDAKPFDPRSAPAFDKNRPLEERGDRGMGIHLVRTLAEDMEYQRIDGRNQLRVTVRR
jgi:serine/threonine-protein kinase RsbW/sigma-B regulation protein RsbU (phosphoserine phosphatase)